MVWCGVMDHDPKAAIFRLVFTLSSIPTPPVTPPAPHPAPCSLEIVDALKALSEALAAATDKLQKLPPDHYSEHWWALLTTHPSPLTT